MQSGSASSTVEFIVRLTDIAGSGCFQEDAHTNEQLLAEIEDHL